MSARNPLLTSPPHPVEQAISRLGGDLRAARLRRNMTIREAAERIGTGERAVADAERGKPSTGIAVYAALLWLFGLVDSLSEAASSEHDVEGQALESRRLRARNGRVAGLDNDF